ncbi:MAG: sterol desaturase family protein [Deltaproteobacteria bacterium]|nr:sterol desaturase family protein [Deltaproteobacteria bacterium]
MSDFLLLHEPAIRVGFFFGILAVMAVWELKAPRRALMTSKGQRWLANLGLVFIDTLALRLLFPLMAVDVAIVAERQGWGVLTSVPIRYEIEIILGVVILDFVIYIQHVLFHALKTFWRLHMMHHTDLDFDVTTGVRFHPVEILLSMGIKMTAVALLGISPVAVILFEVLLNATSMFNHGNVCLPASLDRFLRLLVVTPEMHRVHHSVVIRETHSNFGFNLPWWDRLFGTYHAQPGAGHESMTIGLSHIRDPRELTLLRLLALPFTREPGKYPISS